MKKPKTRKCNLCGKRKVLKEQFHRQHKGIHGYQTQCKDCRNKKGRRYTRSNPEVIRLTNIRSKYHLTQEQAEQAIATTHCEICADPFTEQGGTNPPFIDHCHHHDIYRGVICRQCNSALGFARDNVTTLQNMITYLEDHQQTLTPLHHE